MKHFSSDTISPTKNLSEQYLCVSKSHWYYGDLVMLANLFATEVDVVGVVVAVDDSEKHNRVRRPASWI